jgi:5-methylcytosine-specific restriction endonuclease McrA
VSNAALLNAIARTDATFTRRGEDWVGRCLICGGPLRFSARTGEGATVEHILPRSLGGDNDPRNLGIAHPRCNGEKGRHWDPKRRHRSQPERYAALLARLQDERARRWRGVSGGEEAEMARETLAP